VAARTSRPWRAVAVMLVALATGVGTMAVLQTWTPRLGLDLRGGTSITLTARPTAGQGGVTSEKLNEAVEIIRNRVSALAEAEVTTQGTNHIVVEIPGVGQNEIVRMVGSTAELRFRQVLAVQPAGATTPEPTESPSPSPSRSPSPQKSASPKPDGSPKATESPSPKTRPRVAPQGIEAAPTKGPSPSPSESPTPSASPTPSGQGKVKVNTAGPTAAQQAALEKFRCDDYTPDRDDPAKPLLTCDRSKGTKFVLGPALVLGSEVDDASAQLPQNQLAWEVALSLKDEGAKKFAEASSQMVNLTPPLNQFAIVLDGLVVSYPRIVEPITNGQASITGDFSQQEATDLANVLKYGALPLSFETSQVSNVSPTLGTDQLVGGLIAGAIGLALVALYSFLYYRGLGIVVVASLIVAGATTYVAVVLLGAAQGFTLTLAGVAGLIVAIGITADSFVVYFERLRDEVREGRSLRLAVEAGWQRARRTILAADSVSLLAAVVLYVLSVGNVRGFAYALGLTTLIDVAVVFLFTKPMVTLLSRTKYFGGGRPWSGLDPEHLGVSRAAVEADGARRGPGSRQSRPAVVKEA